MLCTFTVSSGVAASLVCQLYPQKWHTCVSWLTVRGHLYDISHLASQPTSKPPLTVPYRDSRLTFLLQVKPCGTSAANDQFGIDS